MYLSVNKNPKTMHYFYNEQIPTVKVRFATRFVIKKFMERKHYPQIQIKLILLIYYIMIKVMYLRL